MKGTILLGALTVFAIAEFRSTALGLKKRQNEEDVNVAESAAVPLDLGDNFKYETFPTEEGEEDIESGSGNEVNSDWFNKTDSVEDGSGSGDDGDTTASPERHKTQENEDSWAGWGDDYGLKTVWNRKIKPLITRFLEANPSSIERDEEINDVEELPIATEIKRDCRRIKFQSANPEIEVLIAVDTNLPECLDSLGEGEKLTSGATVAETQASKRPKTEEVIVYKNDYHAGSSQTMTLTRGLCSNVPSGYNDEISSIDTKGACVIIHEHSDCVGKSAKLRPEATFVSQQLHRIRMNDDISSLELC